MQCLHMISTFVFGVGALFKSFTNVSTSEYVVPLPAFNFQFPPTIGVRPVEKKQVRALFVIARFKRVDFANIL